MPVTNAELCQKLIAFGVLIAVDDARSADGYLRVSGCVVWRWIARRRTTIAREHVYRAGRASVAALYAWCGCGRSQPHGHMAWLHRYLDDLLQFDDQDVQVNLITQPTTEGRDRARGVVPTSKKALVDAGLNARA